MSKLPLLPQLKKRFLESSFEVIVAEEYAQPAAVLVAFTDNDHNPCIVLTKRAEHMHSHRGEVSFPGGKWEEKDQSLTETALRESWEEVGLPPENVEVIGAFTPFETYKGVKVMPIVGVIPENVTLEANPNELDAVFKVPVSFFLQDRRERTDVFDRDVGHAWSPAYRYEGFEIWGFTSRIIIELLNHVYGANINLQNNAPIRRW